MELTLQPVSAAAVASILKRPRSLLLSQQRSHTALRENPLAIKNVDGQDFLPPQSS